MTTLDISIEQYVTGHYFCYGPDGELIGECYPGTAEDFANAGYVQVPGVCETSPGPFWIEADQEHIVDYLS